MSAGTATIPLTVWVDPLAVGSTTHTATLKVGRTIVTVNPATEIHLYIK